MTHILKIKRDMRYCIAIILLMSLEANAYTIDDAIKNAVSSSEALQTQYQQLEAAKIAKGKTYTGFMPQAQFEVNKTTKYSKHPVLPKEQRNKHRNQALTVNQSIFSGGQTVAAINLYDCKLKAAKASYQGLLSQTVLNTIEVYENLLTERENLKLRIQSEKAISQDLDIARSRFKVGVITKTGVLQAKAALAQATAEKISAANRLATAEATFYKVIGTPAPADMTNIDIDNVKKPEQLDDLIQASLSGNAQMLENKYNLDAGQYQVHAKVGAMLPSVYAQASFDRNNIERAKLGNTPRSNSTYVIGMRVPIFQGGGEYYDIKAAKTEKKSLEHRFRYVQQEIRNKMIENWYRYESAKAVIDFARQEIDAKMQALEGIREENAVGSKTTKEVLDAENELLKAKISARSAKRELVVSLYRIWDITGELSHITNTVALEG